MKNEDNNKKWEWIIEQFSKPRTYIILLVISLLIPLVINCLYKLGDTCSSPILTKWTAADALSFYGSYLSFLGTVVLGAVTVYQTKKAHQQTEKANNLAEQSNELAEQMQKLEQARFTPIVSAKPIDVQTGKKRNGEDCQNEENIYKTHVGLTCSGFNSEKYFNLYVEFKNNSEYPVCKMIVIPFVDSYDDMSYWGLKESVGEINIPPFEEKVIQFIVPRMRFDENEMYDMKMDFIYENIFGYTSRANLYVKDINKEVNILNRYKIEKVFSEQ